MSPLVKSVTENYQVARRLKGAAVWKKRPAKVEGFGESQSICREFIELIRYKTAFVCDKEHKMQEYSKGVWSADICTQKTLKTLALP